MFYITRNEIDKTRQYVLNDPQWYLGPESASQENSNSEWTEDGSKAYPITKKSDALKLLGKLVSEDHIVGLRMEPS